MLRRHALSAFFLAPVLALTVAVTAAAPDPAELSPDLDKSIRATLQARVPTLAVSQLHASPIPGLYEILSPDGLFYTDVKADYLIVGRILETSSHHNLTGERWTALNAVDFASLPFELAIKTVRGNGAQQIAVFADPNCPYCQELETRLAKLDNLTVYVFLFPLEELHPGATSQAHAIWCAPDRSAAWAAWMLRQEAPGAPATGCSSDPVAALARFGEGLRIKTTPTIFFSSGRRYSGLPTDQEFARLFGGQSESVSSAPTAANPNP